MIGYHATDMASGCKISADGVIKKGCDGVVYFCKAPEDACKFLMIRGIKEMMVFKFEVPDEMIEESFDHSEAFFACKAYYAKQDIPKESILDVSIWSV